SPGPLPDPLSAALGETGAIGATVRQLAHRLNDSPSRVGEALYALERNGRALRMGRGLWVLREYERLSSREDFATPEQYDERFERENGISLGRYSGPITFRSNESLPVHRWWPFVQGYSAEFVRDVLAGADLPRGASVLDPFAGSGTTLVEARRSGARGVGTELLAPAVLAARVKTHFELNASALGDAASRVVRSARTRRRGALPFLKETVRQFDPAALTELTKLRDALPAEGGTESDAVRLAFGRILIPASRLHRSPCLGYQRRPAPGGPAPIERFEAAIQTMQEDLRTLSSERNGWGPSARIDRQDARAGVAPPESIDLAVTSPPYVNGMDYVMNYKLDLAWLGYATSYADLARLRGQEVACDNLPRAETAPFLRTGNVPDPWLGEILPEILENVRRKGTYRRSDAHAVVHRYFSDLEQVLRRVHRALRPGARFLLVVGDSLLAGTYIPGDLILARIGARVGFSIESVEVARPRRSGQRRSFELRESIVTLRRAGRRR
ncbi:MAG: hypothetical protein WBG19_00610, partial [Thermoplasmata archaeon]